ncbi:MAG: DUF2382 domain-containing protein [Luteococcus japonicus]
MTTPEFEQPSPREPFAAVDALAGDAPHEQAQELTLLREQMVASTATHEWARVRVTKRIITEERTITVPVRREELVVEYLDDEHPKAHPGTVHGSTGTVDSRVVQEFVLHQEEPRVVVEARPYEKVQMIVDTQRSVVQVDGQLAREEIVTTEIP